MPESVKHKRLVERVQACVWMGWESPSNHRNDAFSDKTMHRVCAIACGGWYGILPDVAALP